MAGQVVIGRRLRLRLRSWNRVVLGAGQRLSLLAELLRDPEWTVRRQAAIALGQIGPDAKAAIPALESLVRDPDHLVRKAAVESLRKIRN